MQVKICGMREVANLRDIADLSPDFLGFIFYAKSTRFVAELLDADTLRALPPGVRTVGVFVDADLPTVLATTSHYHLDYVQLHGHETPAYCQAAHAQGLRLIKAFSIGERFDFSTLSAYEPFCELFLFDTKGAQPGGNGTTFDWCLLADYQGTIPFLLSGGLGLDNASELRRFHHPRLAGYDFNSQLETAPALKDVAATRQLLAHLQA
jgi:phosphoribosylanthranilate isomerase